MQKFEDIAGSHIYLQPLTVANMSSSYPNWLNDPQANQFLEARHQTHDLNSCDLFGKLL